MVDVKKWVDYIWIVMVEIKVIVGYVVDMEIGLCGFLLVGQDEFLELYWFGEIVFKVKFVDFKQIVSDNLFQVVWLVDVEIMLIEWQCVVVELNIVLCCKVEVFGGDIIFVVFVVCIKVGKVYFDKFCGIIVEFYDIEVGLIEKW